MSAPPRNLHWQRRCAAFLIDASFLVPASLLCTMHWWLPQLRDADAALDVLRTAMDASMADALGNGSSVNGFYASLLSDPAMRTAITTLAHHVTDILISVTVGYALLSAIWNLGGECSPWQGSPGKHMLGLRVVDAKGRPPVFAQLLVRQLAAGLSWLTLNLGHLMALLPPYRSLHDRIAGTDVVASTTP